MKNKIKAILFDAEDIIYFRDEETMKPVTDFFRNNGFNIDFLDFKRAYEKYKLDMYKGKISRNEHLKKTLEELKIKFDDSFFQEFAEVFRQSHSNVKVNQDIKSLFERLKQKGIKIAILTDTSSSEREKRDWFRKIELDNFIDAIICSHDTSFTKDSKEPYLIALKRLNLKPHEVLFVGHCEYEMKGAKKANVKSVSLVKGIKEDIYIDNVSKIKI